VSTKCCLEPTTVSRAGIVHTSLLCHALIRHCENSSKSFATLQCRTDYERRFSCRTEKVPMLWRSPTDCHHGLLPGPFLLSYFVYVFMFSLFFRFCAVR